MAALLAPPVETRAAAENLFPDFRPKDGVRDPVFAVLLAFVLDNHVGDLDSTRVRAEVEKTGRKAKLPYRWIETIHRGPSMRERPATFRLSPLETGGPGLEVTSTFDREIDVPVPYNILMYHPGSFLGTSRMRFREVPLGRVEVPHASKKDDVITRETLALGDVHLYILEEGRLEIDIDGWLDRMAGAKLDDTRVAALAIFMKDGLLYGMALGYNRKGEPRSGTLAFAEDKILYPNPPELKSVARQMRRTLEFYDPEIAERYRKW